MSIHIYPEAHAYFNYQVAVIDKFNILKYELDAARHQATSDAIDSLLSAYFNGEDLDVENDLDGKMHHPYRLNLDVDANTERAVAQRLIKLMADIQEELDAVNFAKKAQAIFGAELEKFELRHRDFIIKMHELQQLIQEVSIAQVDDVDWDKQPNTDLIKHAKLMLDNIKSYNRLANTKEDEKLMADLLSAISAGIRFPRDIHTFNTVIDAILRIPKNPVRYFQIGTAILGGMLVLAALIGVAVSITALVMTGGAVMPAALVSMAAFVAIGALGVTIIAKRQRLDASVDPAGVFIDLSKADYLTGLRRFSGLFVSDLKNEMTKRSSRAAEDVVPQSPSLK